MALAAAGDGPLLLPCSGLGDGLLQQTGGELLSEPGDFLRIRVVLNRIHFPIEKILTFFGTSLSTWCWCERADDEGALSIGLKITSQLACLVEILLFPWFHGFILNSKVYGSKIEINLTNIQWRLQQRSPAATNLTDLLFCIRLCFSYELGRRQRRRHQYFQKPLFYFH